MEGPLQSSSMNLNLDDLVIEMLRRCLFSESGWVFFWLDFLTPKQTFQQLFDKLIKNELMTKLLNPIVQFSYEFANQANKFRQVI